MNNTIFNLSEEEYQQLLDSGIAEKVIKNHPKNISIFRTEKNRYIANQAVFELILSICEGTGADPADLYEFFEDNRERVIAELDWFNTDLLDKEDIINRLEEEV